MVLRIILFILVGATLLPGGFALAVNWHNLVQIQLSDSVQLTFDSVRWTYYAPKFLKASGLSVFESVDNVSLHGFLRTEVTSPKKLRDVCAQLADLPLHKGGSKGVARVAKIGHTDLCRVTKADSKQIAIQYVFSSEAALRGPASVHYTHYLYFYFPKESKARSESQIAELIHGLHGS